MDRNSERADSQGELSEVYEGEVSFSSRSLAYLLECDRGMTGNNFFFFPIFRPRGEKFDTCLFLGHGLNETSNLKLIPWARALCRQLKIPVLLFPLSFHINRRPSSWLMRMRGLARSRSLIEGNACSSPFNAVISHRFSEKPERFLRGALQSYYDLRDLIRTIRTGRFEAFFENKREHPLNPGVRIHFLGYSISGYLYLVLPLVLREGFGGGSRLVLFSSCTCIRDMNPVSALVLDEDAFQRTKRFYEQDYKKEGTSELLRWMEEEEIGLWFKRLFFNEGGRNQIHDVTRSIGHRILVIGDPQDEVFPLEAIKTNLGASLNYKAMTLGRHEFPFNISDLNGKSFHELGEEIRRCTYPSEKYRNTFVEWLEAIRNFLSPPDPGG